jgi:hypothetical protein
LGVDVGTRYRDWGRDEYSSEPHSESEENCTIPAGAWL